MYEQNRMFRPDFKVDLPQWQPMGEDDQAEQTGQAGGSFVQTLKKKMAGGGKSAGADAGAGIMGAAGGGMQSL